MVLDVYVFVILARDSTEMTFGKMTVVYDAPKLDRRESGVGRQIQVYPLSWEQMTRGGWGNSVEVV